MRLCTALFGKVYWAIFQGRDNNLFSKQGSLCTSNIILIHIPIFVLKLNHNMNNFFMNLIDRWTDDTTFEAIFGEIYTTEYYEAPELEDPSYLF